MVDNTDAGASASGAWNLSSSTPGYVGANYHAHAPGTGSEPYTWSVPVPTEGTYQVYARRTAHANRATNATYTIEHTAGTTPVVVNQQHVGGDWPLLGSYAFPAGTASVSLSDAADGYVIAHAVKLVATSPATGGTGGAFYVHTDHLGTPQVVTDANQGIAWRADYAPFGEAIVTTAAAENPLQYKLER
ncbi:MAG: RHS domain-containing protein [Gammaproteobacteria bacterium]|nr:RHS domain-containing protein [Gammaproteobacteria bacterium]MDJ0891108.1 RHS domain-containing protein [Gammaproteobacteria bacterium]